jgi:hypothetical protein
MQRIATATLALGIVFMFSASAYATTYYVSTTGNDLNDGTSTATPWQTLTKVNYTTFAAGDTILFKRGGVWTGILSPCSGSRCSGTSLAYLKLDAYDIGAAPRIDGNGASPATIYLLNQEYWEIRNFEVTNSASTGRYSGIMAVCDRTYPAARTCSHVYIGYNNIHDVSGTVGSMLDAGIHVGFNIHNYRSVCFLGICGFATDWSNYWDDVTIEYNAIQNVADSGVYVSESNPGFDDWVCDGNTPNCAFGKTKSTNVRIRNNTIYSNTGNGILAGITSGAVAEYNLLGNWGLPQGVPAAGIWSFASTGALIQHNEVYGGTSGGDRMAFDIDWGNISNYVQYNYSHNNYGGMVMFWEAYGYPGFEITYIDDPIVRFNVSVNDGIGSVIVVCGGGMWSYGANPPDIENNTIYQSATNYYTGATNTTSMIGICGTTPNPNDCTGPEIQRTAYIYNNIFEADGVTAYPEFTSSTIFDFNVFYNNAGTTYCEPSDNHRISTNPMFVSYPAAPSTIDDFKLKPTSPALGNGYPSAYLGPVDYWGNTVSSTYAPNRGAYDGPGLCECNASLATDRARVDPLSASEDVIAFVNSEPIAIAEFMHAVRAERGHVTNYFQKKYGALIGRDSWHRQFGSEQPADVLKKRALDAAVRIKIEQMLMRDRGWLRDVSYSAFLADFARENLRRRTTSLPIAGPQQYGEDAYFEYLVSNGVIKLKEQLPNLTASSEELRMEYERLKESLFNKGRRTAVEIARLRYSDSHTQSRTRTSKKAARNIMAAIGDRARRGASLADASKQVPSVRVSIGVLGQGQPRSPVRTGFQESIEKMAAKLSPSEVSDLMDVDGSLVIVRCTKVDELGYVPVEEALRQLQFLHVNQAFENYVGYLVDHAVIETKTTVLEQLEVD